MSAAADNPRLSPAARQYTTVSLLALLVLTLGLAAKGFGVWALPPLLLGVAAVVFQWRAGPLLLPPLLIFELDRLGPSALSALLPYELSTMGYFSASELREVDPLLDSLLVAAVLAYSVGHYRLLGLTRNLFPVDPRRVDIHAAPERTRRDRFLTALVLVLVTLTGAAGGLAAVAAHRNLLGVGLMVALTGVLPGILYFAARAAYRGAVRRRGMVRGKPHLRPPETVDAGELTALLLTVPLWTALGFVAWTVLNEQEAPLAAPTAGDWESWREQRNWTVYPSRSEAEPPRRSWTVRQELAWEGAWRLVLVVCVGVVGLLLASTAFGYLRRLRAPVAENLLYLQDQLWRATRGEQSLLNRWLTWARLRAQKRKE